MPRREDEELEKKLIPLFKGDFELLRELLANRMTPTTFIRRMVRKTIQKSIAKREHLERNVPDVHLE